MKDGGEAFLALIAALGGSPAPLVQFKKIEVRVAMVDRSGRILFYGIADEARGGLPPVDQTAEKVSGSGELDPVRYDEQNTLAVDLRDERVAAHYLKAALSKYGEEGVP